MAKKEFSEIKDILKERVSDVVSRGKEAIGAAKKAYTTNKEYQENIQAAKAGISDAKRRKLSEMKEQAKVQAPLNLRAQQAITPRAVQVQPTQQAPQIYKIPRRGMNIYSFTNRPFMDEPFMGEDPFIGSSPFFLKRRRP